METDANIPGQWTKTRLSVVLVCSGIIAVVFFHAVYLMAADWDKHLQRMHEQVFDARWSGIMAWVVPAVYLTIGGVIAYRPWNRAGLWLALGYVTTLCGYLTLGKYDVIDICSCIGVVSSGGYGENMRFNGKLLGVVLLAIALDRRWPVKIGLYVLGQWRHRRKEGSVM